MGKAAARLCLRRFAIGSFGMWPSFDWAMIPVRRNLAPTPHRIAHIALTNSYILVMACDIERPARQQRQAFTALCRHSRLQ
jgi:hypothetical protein